MPTIEPVNTTYEPFSQEPEYIGANQAFIAVPNLSQVTRFLDLACGTGLVSGMLLDANPRAHLHGIDYDPTQIELAESYLRSLGHSVQRGFDLAELTADGKPVVMLDVCSADELPFSNHAFDCVTICNAIHMLPDRQKLLIEISRVLRPGGLFGFNTSFYAGTYAEGTEEHYFHWVAEADRHIKQLNQKRMAAGEEKIGRLRGQARAAFQNTWYTHAEWLKLLADAGLEAHYVNERIVPLDERCLRRIAQYGGFAEVLLSGYPVQFASEALQATAQRSLELTGVAVLPRNYLEVWARKL